MTKTMTAQEVFDTAVRGVIEQGVPSYDGVRCLYRGPNGTKCAAGHLIPDDLYTNYMDTGPLEPVVRAIGLSEHIKLIDALQIAHDSNFLFDTDQFVPEFRREAILVAERYGLDPSVATTCQPRAAS